MDTSLIRRLLKKFKCFKGVYSSDMLPFSASLPLNIIVNTDPSNMPGQHWVSISINKEGYGYYFDSFGIPPFKEDIFKFLEEKCDNGWTYNKVSLQTKTSTTCGHYCVLYVIFRCQNLSNEYFLSKFNENTRHNDIRMEKIFGKFSLAKYGLWREDE